MAKWFSSSIRFDPGCTLRDSGERRSAELRKPDISLGESALTLAYVSLQKLSDRNDLVGDVAFRAQRAIGERFPVVVQYLVAPMVQVQFPPEIQAHIDPEQ